jgi:hypothetical protein
VGSGVDHELAFVAANGSIRGSSEFKPAQRAKNKNKKFFVRQRSGNQEIEKSVARVCAVQCRDMGDSR